VPSAIWQLTQPVVVQAGPPKSSETFAWPDFSMRRVRGVVVPAVNVIVTGRDAQSGKADELGGQDPAKAQPSKVTWPEGRPPMVKLVAAPDLTEVLLLIGWLVPSGVASRTMQPTPEGTEVSATLTSEKGLSLWELPVHAWPASAAHVTINTISVLRSLTTKHLISRM